ncbi:hypothetical protein [Roseateles sp. BYS96W]|uniref:DUF1501 domain-containing protein n=1 Tax=Pelomonas nitida TaxID=3299027 RepID=A0ABW7GC78_9BURK
MDMHRRRALLTGLFGTGHVGLRALASGLPAWLLANPTAANAQAMSCLLSNKGRAQFLVVSASSAGCPLNCNVPGTYDDPAVIHPSQAEFAATDIALGAKVVKGAQVWAGLSAGVRSRTNFFHHVTSSTVHGDHPKVMRVMGNTASNEMLPSIYAKHLAACLGTVQSEPIAVGVSGNSLEQVSFAGRTLSGISPLQLKELLTGDKANPLVQLRSVRDSTLDELNALFKQGGTRQQVAFLDALAASQGQVRKLADDLASTLSAIKDNGVQGQALAAAALVAAKVSPAITLRIPFGGDNHDDADLYSEWFQGTDHGSSKTGVPGIQAVMDALAALKVQDAATFATMNVFGRTLSGSAKVTARKGRDHHGNHAVMVMIGKNVTPGVTGGVALIANGVYGAAPIGGVGRADTHIAAAKTLGTVLGIDASLLDKDFNDNGRVKAVTL